MNLQNIVIVLDHPDEPRNIGAACRAMANNDIKDLRIVGKKENYDEEKVHTLAIHAGYIYDNAKFFDDINAATADCTLSAGTTRRRGKNRGRLLLPEEFAEEAAKITGDSEDSAMPRDTAGRVAVVFGNERTGLTDDQLDMCTIGVTIPSSEDFGSLNLSHAVQIMCYHLFRCKKNGISGYTPLPLERLDKTVKNIADNLQKIGFFKVTGRADMEIFWRSVLARAALSESEAQYIEKTFCKMSGLAGKNKNEN
jgi:tRNA/rRNA methyltransferase